MAFLLLISHEVTRETPKSKDMSVCCFYHSVCTWFERILSFRAHFMKQSAECSGTCYNSWCTQQICCVFNTLTLKQQLVTKDTNPWSRVCNVKVKEKMDCLGHLSKLYHRKLLLEGKWGRYSILECKYIFLWKKEREHMHYFVACWHKYLPC